MKVGADITDETRRRSKPVLLTNSSIATRYGQNDTQYLTQGKGNNSTVETRKNAFFSAIHSSIWRFSIRNFSTPYGIRDAYVKLGLACFFVFVFNLSGKLLRVEFPVTSLEKNR